MMQEVHYTEKKNVAFKLMRTLTGWRVIGDIDIRNLYANGQGKVVDIGVWAKKALELQGFLRPHHDEDLNSIDLATLIESVDEHNLWPFAWNPREVIGFGHSEHLCLIEEEKDAIKWMLSNLNQLKYAPWVGTFTKAEDLCDEHFNRHLAGELELFDAVRLRPDEVQTLPHFEEHLWGERPIGQKHFGVSNLWYKEQYGMTMSEESACDDAFTFMEQVAVPVYPLLRGNVPQHPDDPPLRRVDRAELS